MRYLGIDFGTKRVGIAISDEEGRLAFPNTILKNDEKLIENIKKICQKESVGEIVLGESVTYSGDPNKIMKDILAFSEVLQRKLSLPIRMEKEFMTSAEARRLPGYGGQTRRRQASKTRTHGLKAKEHKPVDASAAALILQRYLDKQKND